MEVCGIAESSIIGNPPRFNYYDIRIPCAVPPLCYDLSNVDKFLAREDVIEALGVQDRHWVDCDPTVHEKLTKDWMADLTPEVAYLLAQNKEVLVYSGDKDFVCNWRGGEKWVNELKWPK